MNKTKMKAILVIEFDYFNTDKLIYIIFIILYKSMINHYIEQQWFPLDYALLFLILVFLLVLISFELSSNYKAFLTTSTLIWSILSSSFFYSSLLKLFSNSISLSLLDFFELSILMFQFKFTYTSI